MAETVGTAAPAAQDIVGASIAPIAGARKNGISPLYANEYHHAPLIPLHFLIAHSEINYFSSHRNMTILRYYQSTRKAMETRQASLPA